MQPNQTFRDSGARSSGVLGHATELSNWLLVIASVTSPAP